MPGVRFAIGLFCFAFWQGCAVGEASADSPKAQDTAANPQLTRAVQLIRKQVGWFGAKPSKYSREFLFTVATMNYVQSRVSPLEYARLSKEQKKLPATPEECLAARAGICGGQVQTAREILRRLEIRNRPVEFYMRGATPAQNHSHIGLEVYYRDGWRFFDITWGTFFRGRGGRADEVLSIEQVLDTENVAALAVTNNSDLWFQQWTAAGLDPFEYLRADNQDVIVGRAGRIHLRPATDSKPARIYTPTHQPNFVGRNSSAADSGALSFRLIAVGRDHRVLTISVSGVAGSGVLVVEGETGKVERSLRELRKAGDHRLDVSKLTGESLTISVRPDSPQGVGYVVFERISLQ
ncbi:MAG: transglutaminase domain-containing protein [Pirellulaceae bacterium]|jgi:hypothetical protein|nr:transglutaminase domain-containing protein [Pirellulaceae bacterium]MDP7019939.1 transglutaminase domain-containing protein [Pirellulaceae bacterium]